MNIQRNLIATALAALCATSSAWATPVTPNSTVVPPTVATFFGGTLLDSVQTFIATPSYSGWARSAVYSTASGLDFYYQFSNSANSQAVIGRLSGYDYQNFTVDAYQTTDVFGIFVAGTKNVATIDRDTFGVVGFNFEANGGGKLQPGESNYVGILRTNAHNYTPGTFAIIDGFATTTVAFAPAVPEPETWGMMLLGVGLLGLTARNRKNRAAPSADQSVA